ncbi:MAG: hypothetical protein KDD11_09415 [Acidobacteria bacterium]|nr:hypothetical protein [Acidobacteriota bacterium]
MTRPILFVSLALLGAVATLPASADVVKLKNGGDLEGKVRDTGDGQVEVVLPYGSITFGADMVASVEPSATLDEEVARRLHELEPDDAQGLYELAQWCRDHDAYTLASRLLEEVLAIDPDHAEARRALGYLRVDGQWLTEEEAHLRRGEVDFRGSWVTPAQRDRILILEQARASAERRSDLEQARLEAELARLEAELSRDQEPVIGLAAQPIYGGSATTGTYYQGVYYPVGGAVVPRVSPNVERELEARGQRRGASPHRSRPATTTTQPSDPVGGRHHSSSFRPPR